MIVTASISKYQICYYLSVSCWSFCT